MTPENPKKLKLSAYRAGPKTGTWPFRKGLYVVERKGTGGFIDEVLAGKFANHRQAFKAAIELLKEQENQNG